MKIPNIAQRGLLLAVIWLTIGLAGSISLAAPNAGRPERAPDEVGGNYRMWKVTRNGNPPAQHGGKHGKKAARTNELNSARVVEIGTGMNYWNGKEFVPSDARFDLTASSFVASRVQHPVTIGANINQIGAVKLVTPDGKKLNSTPVAIGLYDAESGRSAIIGTIVDSAGVMVEENKIVFQNAFDGVCADIVYTLEQGSFEQDIVFTGQINPTDYNFPAKTTRIQIYTEFYNAPRPDKQRRPLYVEKDEAVRKRMASPDRVDETIGFGDLVIGTGKAFVLSADKNTRNGSAMVTKEMRVIENRTFLVESVEYPSLQKGLEALPECGVAQASAGQKKTLKQATIPRPGAVETAAQPKPLRATKDLAHLIDRSSGVVIDYRAHVGGNINTPMVFRGDYTYLVTADVYCNGPVTVEGGAVFKYKAGTSIQIGQSLTSKASAYSPAFFTAMDDDTVGESAAGYTAATTGYTGQIASTGYANPALQVTYVTDNDNAVDHYRFRYAQNGIMLLDWAHAPYLAVKNSQFLKCIKGIEIGGSTMGSATRISVENSLFASVQHPFNEHVIAVDYSWISLDLAHCTIHDAERLLTRGGEGGDLNNFGVYSINSIFSTVQHQDFEAPNTSWGGYHNGFHASFNNQTFGSNPFTSQTYPFQTSGAGNFYLTNSNFRNVGTSIYLNSAIAARLKNTTTYPPVLRTNTTISADEQWVLQAQRDTDIPDLGYHYSALDYLISAVNVTGGATLTWNEGVAVGAYGGQIVGWEWQNYGLFSYSYADPTSARLVSRGTALNRNQFCSYQAVQEQAVSLNNASPESTVLMSWTGGIQPAVIDARFTDFNGMSGLKYIMHGWSGDQAQLRDCRLGPGDIFLESPETFMSFTNNLIERVNLTFDAIDWVSPIHFYNNTIRNSTVWFYNYDPSTTVRDNLFDNSVVHAPYWDWQTFLYDHNAYYQSTTDLLPYHTSDKTLTALHYASAALGDRYVASSTPTLVDAGSRSAPAAGLYHYTTKANQLKEGTSTVDIGFHYVAVGSNGKPADTDNDGASDYLEDRNGNGSVDGGENSWLLYNSPNGLANGSALQVFTPLK